MAQLCLVLLQLSTDEDIKLALRDYHRGVNRHA
jgi:hypothetical protein